MYGGVAAGQVVAMSAAPGARKAGITATALVRRYLAKVGKPVHQNEVWKDLQGSGMFRSKTHFKRCIMQSMRKRGEVRVRVRAARQRRRTLPTLTSRAARLLPALRCYSSARLWSLGPPARPSVASSC